MPPEEPRAAPPALRALFWLLLASPGVLPLVAPYLPFQDWPAHAGIVGGLLHWGEPAARLDAFFEYTGWLKMNMAFYLPAVALGQVLDPLLAVNLTLAAALAALGPATAFFCRAVHAPVSLALLAVPLAMGRHLYCGFAPNALALAVLMLAFGLAYAALEQPSPKRNLAFASVMGLLAFTHAFIYLAGLGLLALLVVRHAFGPARRRALAIGAGLVTSALWFAFVFSRGLGIAGQPSSGPTAFEAVRQAIANEAHENLPTVFWNWLFATHRYWQVDDALQVAWAVLLGIAVVVSAGLGRRRWLRGPRAELLGLAAVTTFVFWLLPENIGPPVNWWGGRLRLPPIVVLLLLPLAGPAMARFRKTSAGLVGAVAVVAVVAFSDDLRRFDAEHMAGFSEVVDAVEPGRKVSFLHYTGRTVDEYPGVALGYFGNFIFLEHGGAVPQGFFERKEVPLVRKAPMPAPSWGLASYFRYPQHGAMYDGFVVQMHPHSGKPPFRPQTLKRLEEVRRSGKWAYYRVKGD